MKRCVWIVLLTLLLAVLLPLDALAAAGDAYIADSDMIREEYHDFIQGACVQGDTLYLYGDSHLFSYHVGDKEVTPIEYELPQTGENEYVELECMFSDGEKLYLLLATMRSGENGYGVERLEIVPVELEGEKAVLGEGTDVDYTKLTSGNGDSSYMLQIIDACCVDGYLLLFVYDDSDVRNIYQLDIGSGEGKYIERAGDGDYVGITPYEDGQILIQIFDGGSRTDSFFSYAPRDERMTAVCDPFQLDDFSYGLNNMVYSRESGKLYYRADGYVMAMENFDYANARQVAVLSTGYGPEKAGLLLPGDYYIFSNYDNTIIRNTDPSQMAETRLVVQGSSGDFVMNACYSFANSHSDVDVVLSDDYPTPDDLLEAMMKRDDSVDIYMEHVDSRSFDALYNRGYMLELDNPALTQAVEGMYPFIRNALTRDGAVVAVPVYIYGWTVSLDVAGFEKIGIPKEEVPMNWKELLELLPSLADKLPDDDSLYVFDENNDQRAVRYMLYNSLLEAWRTRQDALGETQSYDDPELIQMMTAIQNLDLGALGVPEPEYDDMGAVGFSTGYGDGVPCRLVQFMRDFTIGNTYGDSKPTPLSVLPGEQPWLPLTMSVAFINPFSKNYELAQEFLVELEANLDDATRYDLSDALNEPVPDENELKAIEEMKEELENHQAMLETAEAIDKPAIKEAIQALEATIADMENDAYTISARDIEWYRSLAPYMTVERFDYLNMGDDNQEIEDLRTQMLAGRIDPATFLKELDRKVRMRALEGN